MSEDKSPENSTSNVSEFNRYLNNNTDILKEKYKEYYKEPFPLAQLSHPAKVEMTLGYIYDIFNFSKYQSNQELNATLRSSLAQNITTFQKQQTASIYDPEMAILLLRYCIEHNDMFAVHYDKKKANKKLAEQEEPQKVSQQEPKQQDKQEQKVEENSKQISPVQTPKSVNKSEGLVQQKSLEESSIVMNQFDGPAQRDRPQNAELIRKQLKGVFQFYCKQQQNVGPNFTFDNISHKCKTMNLGKFMTFTIASNIMYSRDKAYSEGKIQKGQLVSVFKKAAGGAREIQFPAFMGIIEELKKADLTLFQKLGLGEQGPKGKNKLLQKLKDINLPFNTRDPQGRQKSPYGRAFIPKLTAHSGMQEDALRDELSSRRLRINDKNQQYRVGSKFSMSQSRNSEEQRNQQKNKFSLKIGQTNEELQPTELHFLSKLITQEQNDDIFLKDYRLPSQNNIAKAHSNSYDYSRYPEQAGTVQQIKHFGQKKGGFTTRPNKNADIVLPSITKRGGQTESHSQRKSLGPPRRAGTRILLN